MAVTPETTHGARVLPIPTTEQLLSWTGTYDPDKCDYWSHMVREAAAWGFKQALSERQELATLLDELSHLAESAASISAEAGFEGCAHREFALRDRARAWAERIRGGGSDG